MKKIIFTICISLFGITMPKAFTLDTDKIEVHSISKEIISTLNTTYKIDTQDFSTKETVSEEIKTMTKKIISLSLDKNANKKKTLSPYMYIDKESGTKTLTAQLFLDTYLTSLEEKDISYSYIKNMREVKFNEDILVFTYLSDASINEENQDIVFAFWYKKEENTYKLYMPWFTSGTSLEEYFNEVSSKERKEEINTGTYKAMSLTDKKQEVSEETLNTLYENNKESIVQITGIENGVENVYGSGFFLEKGIVATSWSLVLEFLNHSNSLYINDVYGSTYKVEGIITASVEYDVVLLKLSNEVGKKVTLGDTTQLQTDDRVFLIHSLENIHSSIKYGSYIAQENGELKNFLVLHSSEVGSALFNESGEVVAFTSNKVLSSELSYANSTEYLSEIQNILSNSSFENIEVESIETFKENYYTKTIEEQRKNTIPESIWNKVKHIGNIEESIYAELIKGSYVDKIVSLRYKNEANLSLETMYMASTYEENLINSGFTCLSSTYNKKIYTNKEYEIIIKTSFNYLVLIIKEL